MIEFFAKCILIAFFAACYAAGGQGPKFMRRFVGPGVCAVLIIASHWFSLWAVLAGAAFFLPLALPGYGVKLTKNILWRKIAIRAAHGAVMALPVLFLGVGAHRWGMGVLQLVLGAIGSIIFGAFSPFGSDDGDEDTVKTDIAIAVSAMIVWVGM